MAKSIICINFYGHADTAVAGQPAAAAPLGAYTRSTARKYKRANTLHVVSASRIGSTNWPNKKVAVLDYNAALGEAANMALAASLMTNPVVVPTKDGERCFLVTGYSSGGISAIHMARHLNKLELNVFYVGLADAAFLRGDSDYLLKQSGVRATYPKNYYQTRENDPANPEIHDDVVGFKKFDLSSQLPANADFHESAVTIGNQKMYEDVMWCIENC